MRRLLSYSLASAVAMLAASAVSAGTLTNALWEQVTQGIPMTRTFNQLSASGTSTGTSIAVNLSYPAFAATLIVPKSANGSVDLHINVTQGGAQALTATASGASGNPGVQGTVIVMNAVHTMAGANASMFMAGTTTFLSVPVSVGKAGTFMGSFTVVGATHYITVDFYAWTPHTLTFTGLTTKNKALPNVVAMGSFNLNSMGGGSVTLVSPSKISIDGALAQRRTAGFTSLNLQFAPEPGSLLLLAGGALGLVLMGTLRRK